MIYKIPKSFFNEVFLNNTLSTDLCCGEEVVSLRLVEESSKKLETAMEQIQSLLKKSDDPLPTKYFIKNINGVGVRNTRVALATLVTKEIITVTKRSAKGHNYYLLR